MVNSEYLKNLNKAQKEAVMHLEGPLLIVAGAGSGKTKVLTQLNEDILGYRKLGEVNEIIYNSSFDNEEIHGWYITPPNFDPSKKYPLILEIHGGPHLAYGPHFSAELQMMAASGYIVFYDNYRGSSSYGEDFALSARNVALEIKLEMEKFID